MTNKKMKQKFINLVSNNMSDFSLIAQEIEELEDSIQQLEKDKLFLEMTSTDSDIDLKSNIAKIDAQIMNLKDKIRKLLA